MSPSSRNEDDMAGEFGVMIHSIQKSSKAQIRISISEFQGNEYIDIRSFYVPKNEVDETYKPTRRGVTIPIDSYWDLLKGVVELGVALGMLDPELVSELDEKSPSNHDGDGSGNDLLNQ